MNVIDVIGQFISVSAHLDISNEHFFREGGVVIFQSESFCSIPIIIIGLCIEGCNIDMKTKREWFYLIYVYVFHTLG